jgi:hypothetical protein
MEKLEKWLNKKGFSNLFDFIAGRHSPSLCAIYSIPVKRTRR